MRRKTMVITGGDSRFYHFISEAIASLEEVGIPNEAEIGVLDLGLDSEQVDQLRRKGCNVQRPEWSPLIPHEMRNNVELGEQARLRLREYFPGFSVYVWFDADAWAQTPEFFSALVRGAERNGAAVIQEVGSGYTRPYHYPLTYGRWWYGNMFLGYGLWNAAKLATRPVINIGVMALSDRAPHWDHYLRYYEAQLMHIGKPSLGQHAFAAAAYLENLPLTIVTARCNWEPILSVPIWDARRMTFCEPSREALPISVMHLAGPDKRRVYKIHLRDGGSMDTPLTYEAMKGLRSRR
jgi:hypothetical protein